MRALRHIWKQAPAILLLLIFCSGWLATPVLLASPEPITCGMVCCEESGECCCFISRQAHQHEAGETENGAQFVSLQKPCPSHCAAQPSAGHLTLARKAIAQVMRLELIEQKEPLPSPAVHYISLELCRQVPPRAPPIFS